jgi:hypothetical protein
MKLTVDLDTKDAAVFLRFLLRINDADVKRIIEGTPPTMRAFKAAAAKLRAAFSDALRAEYGLQVLRPRPRNAGILRMQPSGRWAVCRPGHEPVEITSGELFRVEVAGELQLTRMEYSRDRGGYYSIDGYELRDGLRAAIDGGE